MQIRTSRDVVVVLANRKRYETEEKCKCIPVYSSSASTFRDVRSQPSSNPGRTTQATRTGDLKTDEEEEKKL
jgi:hypothetical protein